MGILMEELSVKQIAEAVNGKLIRGIKEQTASDVCIDSREAKPGDIFFAIIGEFNDGHRFMKSAYDRGCRVMMISDCMAGANVPDDCTLILVEDSLYALQELAAKYISKFDLRKIAVTGSVGKTTTRDMIYAVLRRKFTTGTSKKNLNSETGMPMTLLSFDKSMQAAVIEMGMDAPGQISRLTEIARPDIAVITNIGYSHLEKLGSRENIFRAKMEIVEGFDKDKVLVINSDDDMLSKIDEEKAPYRIVRAGQAASSDFRVEDVKNHGSEGISFLLINEGKSHLIRLAVPGEHNAVNAALAAAACSCMGISMQDIIEGLSDIKMTGNRLKVMKIGEVSIIDDSYNAAPESMISALKTLKSSGGDRKLAVLAGMNELGEISEEAHRKVGMEAAKINIDLLITIGEKGNQIAEGAKDAGMNADRMLHFDSKEAFVKRMDEVIMPRDIVLLKASRSFELEKLVDNIKEIFA